MTEQIGMHLCVCVYVWGGMDREKGKISRGLRCLCDISNKRDSGVDIKSIFFFFFGGF